MRNHSGHLVEKCRCTYFFLTKLVQSVLNEPELFWREIQTRISLQVRGRSPQKKVTIRSDKLFIDNVMYCYDDDKHEVVRWNRPPSPPRPGSRLGYTWGPRNFDFRVGPIGGALGKHHDSRQTIGPLCTIARSHRLLT